MTRPKSTKEYRRFSFAIDAVVHGRLKSFCQDHGFSMAKIVEKMIEKFVNKIGDESDEKSIS